MADFLILSDYPAIADNKRSLNDNVGRRLWALLYSQGFPSGDTAVEFLYDSPHDISRGNDKWRQIENKHKPRVILALGQEVTRVLGIEGKIFDIRGSVVKLNRRSRDTWVVPTFNPRDLKKPLRMFADEKLERAYFTAGDIRRAVTTFRHGWSTPPERFNVDPTLADVEKFVADSIKEDRLLGADIEADGLNIEYANIVCIGFAWSESDAIVIPLLTEGGREYWKPDERRKINRLLRSLFANCRFVFQNGVGYDVPLLRQRGWDFPLSAFVEDTMIQHHILSPELPHKIGFISSQYGKQPFWKNVFKVYLGNRIYDAPDIPGDNGKTTPSQQEMRIYNARDCVALHQIRNGMNSDMEEKIAEDPVYKSLRVAFEQEMKVARVVIKMYEAGLALDKKKVTAWQKKINEEVSEKSRRLYALAQLPPSFNFGSTDQMRLLLYGERPRGLEGVLESLEKYELGCSNHQYECVSCGRKVTKKFYDNERVPTVRLARCPACKKDMEVRRTDKAPSPVKGLSKETKAYRELSLKGELASVEPLYRLKGYIPFQTKAENPGSAIDKNAVTRYIVWIDKRLDAIAGMRRRLAKHEEEEEGLRKTKEVLVAFSEFGKVKKLQESFYEFQTWSDGKVRPNFLVTGTATGRFSCKSPNLQQIPSGKWGEYVRSCFRADEGHTLISVDFSNLEVQIGARFMGDDTLIAQLEAGLNLHDENTKTFFGVATDHPQWSSLRKAAKIIQFGRLFYGGSDPGIFSQVVTAVPDSGLTLKVFKDAVKNYMASHPTFATWVEEVQDLAQERRISPNAFGRVRVLLGDASSIDRVALNNPIQGSAADAVAQDMVLLDELFVKAGLKTTIVLQIHDELVFHVPNSELKEAGKIIKKVMNRTRKVNGYSFKIPIDAEIGTHWGAMDSYNLTTGKITKGSKH